MNPELFLYGDIGGDEGVSAAEFVSALRSIPDGQQPTIRIHSDGGGVSDGTAIFNAIKNRPGGCATQIDGLAASMASVIALAGKPVRMAGNARLMIHNVQASADGDADDLRQGAERADQANEILVASYSAKTGLSRAKVREMMDKTTVLNARQAKELGFVDEITDEIPLAASGNLSGVKRALTQRAAVVNPTLLQNPEEKRNFFQELSAFLRGEKIADDLTAKSADLTNKLTLLGTERDGLTAKVTDLTGKVTDLEGKLKLEVDGKEAAISKEVITRLAAAGITDPIKRDPAAAAVQGTTMKRADFDGLQAYAQAEFCRKGGKLID